MVLGKTRRTTGGSILYCYTPTTYYWRWVMIILITILAFGIFLGMCLSGFAAEKNKQYFKDYPQLGGKL